MAAGEVPRYRGVAKKLKYIESYLQQEQQFSPFMASVDSLLGMEVEALMKQLAGSLATKLQQPWRICPD